MLYRSASAPVYPPHRAHKPKRLFLRLFMSTQIHLTFKLKYIVLLRKNECNDRGYLRNYIFSPCQDADGHRFSAVRRLSHSF